MGETTRFLLTMSFIIMWCVLGRLILAWEINRGYVTYRPWDDNLRFMILLLWPLIVLFMIMDLIYLVIYKVVGPKE
jgi:hypothetical protein